MAFRDYRGGEVFVIADRFAAVQRPGSRRVDLNTPLPLGYPAAVRRALGLRNRGNRWSWAVIADVMEEYHGWRRSPSWWAKEVRALGAPVRTKGQPFNASTAEQARRARRRGPGAGVAPGSREQKEQATEPTFGVTA